MQLLSEYNSPYLFAISLVIFIGLLEVISLIFGSMLSGIIDTHISDSDFLSSGHIGQALHYLNIGRIPSLIIVCLLAGYFGLLGILIQHGWITLWQTPLTNLLLAPVCFLLACVAVHYTGRAIAPWLPVDESSAITEDRFIGKMAMITGHNATQGSPCEGKFTDEFGQTHYLLLEPEAGHTFHKGDKVLIICRLSASRYLAEPNPWPNHL
ncbi:OB-fold-containig protein [Kosakonia sp.]|uniref:OB-fold-containig protein n=1 Tax=Kosakonia sp. TaxID=1916651 RepID=UPI00289E7AF5|nr:OB-fold-containig protein [Kosakonia sp.]